jgi:hypothetical protein
MNQETVPTYRGVICQCCRQPIPLPGIVLRMEASLEPYELGAGQKSGRVFTLRCRSCEKEMPYRTSEIVDVEGTPKPRPSRTLGRNARQAEGLSRAANG